MDNKTRGQVLLVLFLGVFMGALDIAIVGPALPAIGQEYGIDERGLAWIFTSYVLFSLVGSPLMAKISDRFGRRSAYLLAISIFAVGSLVVAVAPHYWLLLFGRALQGFGAGGVFPVASAVIGDTFPEEKRGRALGLIGAVFGLVFLIGPFIGGLFLIWSWKLLFLINLPLAAFTLYMGARLLPKTHPSEPQPFDALGTLLLFLMLSGLTVGVSQLDTKNLLGSLISPEVGPFMAVFLIMIPLVIWQERRAVDPLIRPSLFSTRQLLLVNGLAIGAGLSETALVFLPDMAVKGFNVEESVGSLLMLPVVLAMAVGSPLAGRFLDKWGSKRVIIFGTVFVTIGVALLGGLGDLLALYIVSSIIVGVGMGGLLGAPLRYIFLNEASLEDRAAAQGLLTVSTGVGQLLGSALVGAVVASQGGGIGGYKVAFVCVAVVSAVLIFMALGLKNRAEELRSLSSTQEKVAESSLTAN